MPIRDYHNDIDAEGARSMSRAFDEVCRVLAERGLVISPQSVAARVAQIFHTGERDVANIVAAVLGAMKPES